MSQIINKEDFKELRQGLRKNMPKPEQKLWYFIRGKQINGVKFRRQVSVGNFILDFYSFDLKLAIEIDGDSHFETNSAILKDRKRTEFLNSEGIKVIRFTNEEIMKNINGCLEKLVEEIEKINK